MLPLGFSVFHAVTTLPMVILEVRPESHLAVAVVEIGLTWIMARKIRDRVISEASRHNFLLAGPQNTNIRGGPKPPSSGGGAF